MSLTESEEFDIRYTRVDDIDPLRFWLRTEGILHWYPPSGDDELENFIRVWMGFARFSAALTATYRGESVGMACLYLMPYRKIAHQALFQVIVDPNYQQKGIGKALIRNIKHLAKNSFRLELLNVEILDESPLISLLERFDFNIFARQESYVKERGNYYPRILMEAEL